ncbi:MAG: hypothetical protein IKY61_08235 [Thermoguttaceae bacterium]|nr:hypothetical protein [Thermoguttaceae bacterium]
MQRPYGFPTKIIGSAGDVATQTFEPQDLETNPLRATFALYPSELAFGDVERNVGDEAVSTYAPFDSELAKYIDLGAITITSPDVPGRYEVAPELARGVSSSRRSGSDSASFRPVSNDAK